MWGDTMGTARSAPVRPPGAGLRIGAVVLLVLAAGLALGGTFGAFSEYGYSYSPPSSSSTPPTTTTTVYTGWRTITTPAPKPGDPPSWMPLDGYPLTAGVVVVLLAVAVLVTSGRRPGARVWGRSVGVGAAALLAGVIVELWAGLLASALQTAAQTAAEKPGSGSTFAFTFGLGAWLELVALVGVTVAGVLLLVSASSERRAAGVAGLYGPPRPFQPAGHGYYP